MRSTWGIPEVGRPCTCVGVWEQDYNNNITTKWTETCRTCGTGLTTHTHTLTTTLSQVITVVRTATITSRRPQQPAQLQHYLHTPGRRAMQRHSTRPRGHKGAVSAASLGHTVPRALAPRGADDPRWQLTRGRGAPGRTKAAPGHNVTTSMRRVVGRRALDPRPVAAALTTTTNTAPLSMAPGKLWQALLALRHGGDCAGGGGDGSSGVLGAGGGGSRPRLYMYGTRVMTVRSSTTAAAATTAERFRQALSSPAPLTRRPSSRHSEAGAVWRTSLLVPSGGKGAGAATPHNRCRHRLLPPTPTQGTPPGGESKANKW